MKSSIILIKNSFESLINILGQVEVRIWGLDAKVDEIEH
jgi:hypothetical protein